MQIDVFEDQLLNNVIQMRGTDIHIEPRGEEWEVRIRVQGHLQHYASMSVEDGTSLIQRIKVQANMNYSEKRQPQDGSYIFNDMSNVQYDLRVSSIPLIEGEKLVIRVLYQNLEYSSLNQLGMNESDISLLLDWLNDSMGLYLITGPTGSGKTTTLYAILQHLNRKNVNITTIEDPVEVRLRGINQIQVSESVGLTFENGLRSLLRQDPDIIAIGEIRDRSSAHIAVRASITGHLVFATLHANDTASAITRLLEMGIEPYLIAASLKGVVSQKMMSQKCVQCHSEIDNSCILCAGTGVVLRYPKFELMQVSEDMANAILEKRPPSEIRAIYKENCFQRSISNTMVSEV